MRAMGMQCLFDHCIKMLMLRMGLGARAGVLLRPKTCIMLDALTQHGAIQFGTGCDSDGLKQGASPSHLPFSFFPEKRNKPVAGSGLFLFRR